MSDPNVKSSSAASALQGRLESPAPGQKIYDEAVFLSGWVYAPGRDPASCRVRAYLDDCCVAETRILSYRPDVCEKLDFSRGVLTGFRMLGKIRPAAAEPHEHEATLRITASWDDGVSNTLAEQPVRLVPALLRARPYGEVVYPENETLLHRENIYGSGPPIEEPGIEVSNLLREYLPERSSVVDVGCGAGAYGPGLMAAGHDWLGLETNSHCCDILLRRQLPFRRVHPESGDLPCADGEWDCAIAIEVLEHVKDPEMFLREIARVIRGRALLSVPNMEVLPYFHDWRVVPGICSRAITRISSPGPACALCSRGFSAAWKFSPMANTRCERAKACRSISICSPLRINRSGVWKCGPSNELHAATATIVRPRLHRRRRSRI